MRQFGYDCYRDRKDRWRMWWEGYHTWNEFLIAAGRRSSLNEQQKPRRSMLRKAHNGSNF